MLIASILPDIIALQFLHNPGALPVITWARVVALGMATLFCMLWQPLQSLWKYAAILLVFTLSQHAMNWLSDTAWWRDTLANLADPFTRSYFGTQLLKFGGVAIMLIALFVLGYRRRDAYLVRGDIHAPIRPEPWMGFPKPEPWTRFGTMWLLFLGIGMLVILSIFGRLDPSSLFGATPLLPVVLLLAALNAFSEEVTYRSAQLAPLVPAVGVRQAWWLTAVLFGVGHYYGVPYGLVGVLLATFMGWFLAKAMLETRGFFWPWLVHFSQDLLIFWFIAAGSIQPGG
jgi:membrane protease YdiL (CAAX protease family)